MKSTKLVHEKEICSTDLVLKYTSFFTFKACLVASSRRVGFYMVINSSRKALDQTGSGHYSPVAGVNLAKGYALILEVARFKYPSFWVRLDKLYDSMKELDKSANTSRGFSLIARDFRAFSEICRISADLVSMTNLKNFMDEHIKNIMESYLIQMESLSLSQEDKYIKITFKFLTSLIEDFNYLLAYYLFDFSIRLEYKEKVSDDENQILGEKLYHKILNDLNKNKLTDLVQKMINTNREYLENYPIFTLIGDFQPFLLTHILTLILLALPKNIREIAKLNYLDEYLNLLKSESDEVNHEIKRIKMVMGWHYNEFKLTHF